MTTTSHRRRQTTRAMRHAMVASQLRTNAVSDPRVVARDGAVAARGFPARRCARARLSRHARSRWATGAMQNPPLATGRLLTEARSAPSDRVLLIGAAGGYTAAVLARAGRAGRRGRERCRRWPRSARAGAGRHRANVDLVEGPLAAGARRWRAVRRAGRRRRGRAAARRAGRAGPRRAGASSAGIVDRGVTRLAAGARTAGGFGLVAFADIDCVVLPGFARPRGFRFPG